MALYHKCSHEWTPEELSGGLWVSLGLAGPDGVKEMTSRKFISFDFRGSQYAEGTERFLSAPAEITFDKIVVSDQPAGRPKDILHNGKVQKIPEGERVLITSRWRPQRWV
jgi:hypothetical protein